MDSGKIADGGAEVKSCTVAAPVQGGPYRKRESTVHVRFATTAMIVQTLEGPVQAHAGDAIVTGSRGEQWPVRPDAFAARYRAAENHQAGKAGFFITRAQAVRAQRVDHPFQVALRGDGGTLSGIAGDWLVEYDTGDRAVIGEDIFAETYCAAIDDAPLVIGLTAPVNAEMEQAAFELASVLRHTSCVILRATDGGVAGAFTLAGEASLHALPRAHVALPPLADVDASMAQRQAVYLAQHCFVIIAAAGSAGDSARGACLPYWTPAGHLPEHPGQADAMFGLPSPAPTLSVRAVRLLATRLIQQRTAPHAAGAYLKHVLLALVPARLRKKTPAHDEDSHHTRAGMVLAQLSELDAFNAEQLPPSAADADGSDSDSINSPLAALHQRADTLASYYQSRWQRLVFATTGDIANGLVRRVMLRDLGRRAFSLSACGWFAAMLFAAFTELAGGCDEQDWFGNRLCASSGWRHWAGTVLIICYLGVLLLALWRYVSAKTEQLERKHQDYRLLAECLRVQDVWARSAIRRNVADSLPPKAMADATWVVPAVRALAMLFAGDARNDASASDGVRRRFVTEQREYYETTMIKRREKACRALSRRASSGLALFVLGVLVLIFNTLGESLFHHGIEGMGHHYLVIFTLAGLAWWAANKKILDSFALEGEIKRGRLTLAALTNAETTIAALVGDEAAILQRDVVVGIGTLFVVDQANWHALHRERPIEAVTGG